MAISREEINGQVSWYTELWSRADLAGSCLVWLEGFGADLVGGRWLAWGVASVGGRLGCGSWVAFITERIALCLEALVTGLGHLKILWIKWHFSTLTNGRLFNCVHQYFCNYYVRWVLKIFIVNILEMGERHLCGSSTLWFDDGCFVCFILFLICSVIRLVGLASGLILYPFLVGWVFILVILRSLLFNILNLRYILQYKCPMCWSVIFPYPYAPGLSFFPLYALCLFSIALFFLFVQW